MFARWLGAFRYWQAMVVAVQGIAFGLVCGAVGVLIAGKRLPKAELEGGVIDERVLPIMGGQLWALAMVFTVVSGLSMLLFIAGRLIFWAIVAEPPINLSL